MHWDPDLDPDLDPDSPDFDPVSRRQAIPRTRTTARNRTRTRVRIPDRRDPDSDADRDSDRNADPDSDRDRPRSGPDRVSVRPRLGLGPSRIHGVRVSRCSAGPDPTQPDPRTTQSSRRRADAGCADCYSLHIDAVLAYCGVVNCPATFEPRRYISAPLECNN